LRNPLR